MKHALLIAGHGSRSNAAVRQFEQTAKIIAKKLPHYDVAWGYLEFATPTIDEAFNQLITNPDITHVTVMPLMLMAAGHIKNDIPSEVNGLQQQHPHLTIQYGVPIDIHPLMLQASKELITASLKNAPIALKDSLLLVVGRGTSDSDANGNIFKIARMLYEGLSPAWVEIAFSGTTTPLLETALQRTHLLNFKQVVVFPYFLFTGRLIDRIHQHTQAYAQAHPEINVINVPFFGSHALVVQAFLERLNDVHKGTGNMNCQLCQYRVQIIGHEHKHGQAQQGHHHHVKGAGTDHAND